MSRTWQTRTATAYSRINNGLEDAWSSALSNWGMMTDWREILRVDPILLAFCKHLQDQNYPDGQQVIRGLKYAAKIGCSSLALYHPSNKAISLSQYAEKLSSSSGFKASFNMGTASTLYALLKECDDFVNASADPEERKTSIRATWQRVCEGTPSAAVSLTPTPASTTMVDVDLVAEQLDSAFAAIFTTDPNGTDFMASRKRARESSAATVTATAAATTDATTPITIAHDATADDGDAAPILDPMSADTAKMDLVETAATDPPALQSAVDPKTSGERLPKKPRPKVTTKTVV